MVAAGGLAARASAAGAAAPWGVERTVAEGVGVMADPAEVAAPDDAARSEADAEALA